MIDSAGASSGAHLSPSWLLRETFPDLRLFIIGPVEEEDPVPAEVLDALRSDAARDAARSRLGDAPLVRGHGESMVKRAARAS